MIITFLVLLILILSATQCGAGKMAGYVYSLILGSHFVFFGHLQGTEYFIASAVANLIILSILCYRVQVSRLSDVLISVSIIQGAADAGGFIMWWNHLSISPYHYTSIVLYIIVIMSFMRMDGTLQHGTNIINTCFRYFGRPGFALRSFLRQEAG